MIDAIASWEASFTFARHVKPGENLRGHWALGASRIRGDREALARAWKQAGQPVPPAWPIVVTFTRIAARELDCDNLPPALKGVRDELTKRLGLRSDRAPDKVRWVYLQEKAAPKAPSAVRVTIQHFGD